MKNTHIIALSLLVGTSQITVKDNRILLDEPDWVNLGQSIKKKAIRVVVPATQVKRVTAWIVGLKKKHPHMQYVHVKAQKFITPKLSWELVK